MSNSKCVVLLSIIQPHDAIDESDYKKTPEISQFYNATKGGVDIFDGNIMTVFDN